MEIFDESLTGGEKKKQDMEVDLVKKNNGFGMNIKTLDNGKTIVSVRPPLSPLLLPTSCHTDTPPPRALSLFNLDFTSLSLFSLSLISLFNQTVPLTRSVSG